MTILDLRSVDAPLAPAPSVARPAGLPAAPSARAYRPAELELAGELDAASAPGLAQILAAAIEAHRDVQLDLSDLTFCDVVGLRVLLAARDRAEALGGSLRCVGAPRQLRRLAMLAGAFPLIA